MDILINAVNMVAEKDIRDALTSVCTPDISLVTCWMNYVKVEPKQYREVHGLPQLAYYLSRLIATAPDAVTDIKEKTLYKKPDNTSFLMVKLQVTGSALWTIVMRNVVQSATAGLFSRSGFFGRIFRVDRGPGNNGSTYSIKTEASGSSAAGTPISPINSASDSACEDNDIEEAESIWGTVTKSAKRSSGALKIQNPDSCDEVSLDAADDTSSVFQPSRDLFPAVSRKRKQSKQQSMVHKQFFNFRQRKIHVDQVEIATEGTKIELQQMPRQGSFVVSVVIVIHINAAHRIYKIESFKRLDRKTFFR